MNISAVNCTPIKPQVAFGNGDDEQRYQKVIVMANDMNDELVHSREIKKPVAVALSLGLAGLIAFVSGKKLASMASTLFTKLPESFETGLKKISQSAQNSSKKLIEQNGKFKTVLGKAIGGTENIAKKAYKKIAYLGVAEGTSAAEKASKAFQNISGVAFAASVLPGLYKKDSDGNGVADILEKTTNVYDGTKMRCSSAISSASKIADLITELT